MFGSFKKKEPQTRKELREECEKFTGALRHADAITQTAVGHSINLANSIFIKRFGSPDAFCQKPTSQRIDYIKSLTALVEKMN